MRMYRKTGRQSDQVICAKGGIEIHLRIKQEIIAADSSHALLDRVSDSLSQC